MNVNGSLRDFYEKVLGMQYVSLDMEAHPSVDVVMKPGDPFPFEDGSFDLVVSTSCFEHDPCFWMTFREMCRVVKTNGYIYMSAPSNGYYHGYPGDNWRFYADAGQALALWANKVFDGKVYPVKLEEAFHVFPRTDQWIDYVAVWKRIQDVDTNTVLNTDVKHKMGKLKSALIASQLRIESEIR